ncbi:hypothetical protein [Saccharolobus islandicus]|uniref:Uncharacterized protein n=1 Tax=Saccharolobus islandicus (strain M.16.4 / Kamchatka \|nr:hypothetical protein [Sulfolobus islandicus]ACR41948.1 conserved hypothetical protein [Sulfolobus islandicus M.16.4]
MVVIKKKKENRIYKSYEKKNGKKSIKYVYLASKKAVFLVTGKPRESKYSYGVPVIPLHGYYKSDGKSYTAKELSDYYVVLNLDKDDGLIDAINEGVKIIVIGYSEDDVLVTGEEE